MTTPRKITGMQSIPLDKSKKEKDGSELAKEIFGKFEELLQNIKFTDSGEMVPESRVDLKREQAKVLLRLQVEALIEIAKKIPSAKVSELTAAFKILSEKESILTKSQEETTSFLQMILDASKETEEKND